MRSFLILFVHLIALPLIILLWLVNLPFASLGFCCYYACAGLEWLAGQLHYEANYYHKRLDPSYVPPPPQPEDE